MAFQGLSTRAADYGAKDYRNQDCVIGIADHGDEVGNQVNGNGELGKKKPQGYSNSPRQRSVGPQTPKESQSVRYGAYGVSNDGARGPHHE
jgi:hypothetical protein